MKIIVGKDYADMSRKAANIVSAQVILKPASVLGLATGSTPVGMYRQLIEWYEKGDIDFSQIKTVNLDEYVGLSRDDAQSYYQFMWKYFFSQINIQKQNIEMPDGMAEDIEAECDRYEQVIGRLEGIDLQVLGLGHNGHIGFNEPQLHFIKDTHKVQLAESTRKANRRFFENDEDIPSSAISMGMGTIMKAKKILLLCSGAQKADVLSRVVCGDIDPLVPASILQLHSNVSVVADRDAACEISENSRG